jgi:membrane protein implicated in regulation of membrane protease activity
MGMGVFSAGFGYTFMKYIKNSDSGESVSIRSLTGRVGKVVLPASKIKRGKVLISTSSGTIELTALVSEASDEDEMKIGETILVIDFAGNDAIITKSDL